MKYPLLLNSFDIGDSTYNVVRDNIDYMLKLEEIVASEFIKHYCLYRRLMQSIKINVIKS